MAKLLGLLLAGGALWYGYNLIKREMRRVGEQLRDNEPSEKIKEVKPLKEDKDGVYRPDDE